MNCFLAIIGFLVTLIVLIFLYPIYIDLLKSKNISQVTSQYALKEFKDKQKTPIMGGLLFVVVPVIVFILISINKLNDPKIWFVILSYILFCSVGFIDDFLIIRSNSNDGLSAKTRLLIELVYTIILYILFKDIIPSHITIPFVNIGINLYWLIFFIFMSLLYMAEANAVNFTDGMDGLCAGVSFIALIPFVIFAYIYKQENIFILLICILAGLLAYLKYNHHPAKIFMGDSGSLALGALFASLGLIMNKTVALFFIGGVFVAEMFCVLLQQIFVRVFHKRVFSYTPIHYAFVIKGHKEENIVLAFYLVELLLAIIGFIIGINTL